MRFLVGSTAGFAGMCAAHLYFWPRGEILTGLIFDIAGIACVAYGWRIPRHEQ